jgi:hypothetical protein
MDIQSPIAVANKSYTGAIYVRVDPRGVYREKKDYWLRGDNRDLHFNMHTTYFGSDDNGNPISAVSDFSQ